MTAHASSPRRPAAILWDLGNVLCDWSPRRLYSQLIADEAELDRFLTEICSMEWHTRHDAGASMAENRKPLIKAHPDKAALIEAWEHRWDEMFDGHVEGMAGMVERVAEIGLPQYALSNLPAEKWPPLKAMYPALDLLDDAVISGEEGVVKPDPAIYAITASRLAHPPQHTLFIDDRAENIEAAMDAGFLGHHFTGADALRADLARRGIAL
jgi:2-haloacid dehalogenase